MVNERLAEKEAVMGSCAVKSNQTVIEQPPESEDDNVVRILVSEGKSRFRSNEKKI